MNEYDECDFCNKIVISESQKIDQKFHNCIIIHPSVFDQDEKYPHSKVGLQNNTNSEYLHSSLYIGFNFSEKTKDIEYVYDANSSDVEQWLLNKFICDSNYKPVHSRGIFDTRNQQFYPLDSSLWPTRIFGSYQDWSMFQNRRIHHLYSKLTASNDNINSLKSSVMPKTETSYEDTKQHIDLCQQKIRDLLLNELSMVLCDEIIKRTKWFRLRWYLVISEYPSNKTIKYRLKFDSMAKPPFTSALFYCTDKIESKQPLQVQFFNRHLEWELKVSLYNCSTKQWSISKTTHHGVHSNSNQRHFCHKDCFLNGNQAMISNVRYKRDNNGMIISHSHDDLSNHQDEGVMVSHKTFRIDFLRIEQNCYVPVSVVINQFTNNLNIYDS